MKRREFLKSTALAAAAIAGSPLHTAYSVEKSSGKPTVQRYQEIGKTGLKMSDISYGTGKLPSPSMVLRAIDRGINYFDTAPDYGPSEKYIGEAMDRIQRDKIILASKMCKPIGYPGHLPFGTKKKDYKASVEASLMRLRTDYLDFCFVHAMGEMSKQKEEEKKRLLDEEMLSAVADLKKEGKIRFLAVSSHGPQNMEDLMMEAVQSGHYDLIMMAFNFMKFPRIPEVMKEAHVRGVGVIAMKTLAGAKDMQMEPKGEEFAPAVFKWVLKHPEVNGLVITIRTVDELDLYLRASGQAMTSADQDILDRYARRYDRQYCRTGCGDCEEFCPRGVQIATAMRYQMYFKEYGMERRAMEGYAGLHTNAGPCLACEDPVCVKACTYKLPVRELLCEAHQTLSFTL
jgi:predicted aldo/keto reductase-like oxidoreductase